MLRGASGLSGRVVENIFFFIAAISVALLVLITFLMVFFVLKYERKRHPHPVQIQENRWLEIVWMVVPTILVLSMFYYGYTGFKFLRKVPEGAIQVKVTGRQFGWFFEYPNGIKTEELIVPVGKPIHLVLTSADVIHSFYVPAFKIKQDAVPGMENHLWFKATETGTYDVFCAEYCGLRHSYMLTRLTVLSDEEFVRWSETKQKEIAIAKIGPRGPQLFVEKGCKACHSLDGTAGVGPTMKGLFGKSRVVVTEGREQTLIADESYLRRAIVQPSADIVKGYPSVMPLQQFSEQEVKDLIGYIKELK